MPSDESYYGSTGDLYDLDGSIEAVSFESTLLKGNALGDPHVRTVPVYLPPEYHTDRQRRFPVVYCLSGFTGKGVMLLNVDGWTPNLPQRLEILRADDSAEPMILVMPNCFTRLGGSQYINSTATGPYEDYLTKEIVPMIDERYRTLASREHRGIMGKSSGGYGSIVHGMRHPELFGAIACHSGDMYFEYCYIPDFPKAASGLRRHGGLARFLKAFDAEVRKRSTSIAVLNIVAMSACYSPNPLRPPLGIDLPFSEETGEIRDEVWQRWLEHDPVRMFDKYAEPLSQARLLFLDCGTQDEFNLQFGARILRQQLQERGIRHIHEEFDDGHMRIAYRYDRSLTLLSEAIRG